MGRSLRVEADGGSRGNPGIAGYGALVRDATSGQLLVELAAPLGTASNNVAEYRGLLAGLRAARTIDRAAAVEVALDSKLVVEQMSGRWKIKHPDMRALALEGRDVVADITAAGGSVDFTWIPREDNGDADALSNRGMDGEEVEDWFMGETTRGPEAAPAPRGEPTRVVLVCDDATETAADRAGWVSDELAALVGETAARVITADLPPGRSTGATIADHLGVTPQADADWTEASAQVTAAWDRAVASGGTVVVACAAAPIRRVLAHVLGVSPDRARRLAVASGSLTAIEAWPDGEAVVAFTSWTCISRTCTHRA